MPAIKPAFAGKDANQIFPAFSRAQCGLLISVTDLLQK